jgi:hypothetical protein
MTDETQAAAPQPPEKPRANWRATWAKYGPTKGQVAVMVIGALAVSNVGAWVKIMNTKPQRVVTVGITEMTQGFIAREAVGSRGEAEARASMEAYLAVSQDTLKRVAVDDGVIVLARECVLAGESDDWTAQIDKAVTVSMEKLKAARPIRPVGVLSGVGAPIASPLAPIDAKPLTEEPRG